MQPGAVPALTIAPEAVPMSWSQSGTPTSGNSQLADTFTGSPDPDVADGLDGDDSLLGNGGNDTLTGSVGNDFMSGGSDDDRLLGGAGNDFIRGDGGADTIEGGEGKDYLDGGNDDAADLITDSLGGAWVFAGGGDDTIMVTLAGASDNTTGLTGNLLDAGAGNDLVMLSGNASVFGSGVYGRDGNDTLVGADAFASLFGEEGDDSIAGGGANEALSGGAGADTISGGGGDDAIYGDAGFGAGTDTTADLLSGGSGNDTIEGALGNDTILGGTGDDIIQAGDGADLVIWSAGDGNDVIAMGNGIDTLDLAGWNDDEWEITDQNGNDYILTNAIDRTIMVEVTGVEFLTCFAPGTRILSARGEVPVDSLRAGDLVAAPGRGAPLKPVRWVGHTRVDIAHHRDRRKVAPILLRAGALGAGIPTRDLRVSPEHAFLLQGRLVPAHLLVNGTTIIQEGWHRAMTYWHVELEQHGVLVAEGTLAESYFDDGNRHLFDNGVTALHLDLGAGRDAGRYAAEAFAPPVQDRGDPALVRIIAALPPPPARARQG
jgi:hypothetical protein